jgi:AAA+ ATPase superfamily predicted ATPase
MQSEVKKIIGRREELATLKRLLNSGKSEFLAVYGRRRVGKTFLIRNFFSQSPCVFFHSTGIQRGVAKKQLEQFSKQIGLAFFGGASITPSQSWLGAFEELTKAMTQIAPNKTIVLFFDEFPWMATRRSGLLEALEYYWNRYWDHDPRIKLVICGSTASWVIEKIINNQGGLYNRVTRTMQLVPFTLYETKEFLASHKVRLNHRQILELYMVMGGIPHYLAQVTPGCSAQQTIESLCFQQTGELVNEFEKLFSSLFKNADIYINIIRKIAKCRYGIGQAELMKKGRLAEGGTGAKRMKELEDAGFVLSFLPYGHQEKGVYYKIADEYTLFYLNWIEPYRGSIRKRTKSRGFWLSKAQSPGWKSWSGYSFEAVCHKHIPQIQKALKIDPGADIGSWRYVPKNEKESQGAQIDLLFDRSDDAITICEIKYSKNSFVIDKEYARDLKLKREIYQKQTRTQKQIFLAMIASNGLKASKHSEMIDQEADLEDLFVDI